jgi:hypothetical protein
MEIKAFMLCDAAVIREGLLNVLSAGLTRVYRSSFPAPLGFQMALMVSMTPEDVGKPHTLAISIAPVDGSELLRIDAQFEIGSTELTDIVPLVASIPIAIPDVPVLPAPGAYEARVELEGEIATARFLAVQSPVGAGQPPAAQAEAWTVEAN